MTVLTCSRKYNLHLKIHFQHRVNADSGIAVYLIFQNVGIYIHVQCFSLLYSVSAIREPAALPCLLPRDREEQWMLSPENKQPYSLEYSVVPRGG